MLSDTFSVINLGSTAATFKLLPTCSGGVSSCSTLDSVQVMADSTKRVAVSYQSGNMSAGNGVVRLRARLSTDSTVADSGSITVSPAASMTVDGTVNQTDLQDMRLCAYACFTNIYSHSTVPYYSGDQPRSVTLVNNSLRVFTYPFIHVDISFLPQSPAVDRIELLVRDSANPSQPLSLQGGSNNTYGPVYFYRNNADTSSSPIRIGTMIRQDQYGANNWTLTHGTGIHPMTVTVVAVRGTYSDTATLTIPLLILREPPGAVARGWYVAGMQRLLAQSGGRMVIAEADGSAFVYKFDSLSATYTSPEGDLTRLSKVTASGVTTYVRTYPDSTKVRFDSLGQMLDATDSWGNRVRYGYDSRGRLARIYDPIRPRADSAGGFAYTEFAYDSVARTVSIRPPRGDGTSFDSSRVTILRLTADSSLRAIIDPDGDSTRFEYHASMPWPLHQRPTVLRYVWDRNGNFRRGFTYNGSGSSLWLVDGEGFQYYTCCGNTNIVWRQSSYRDWRPAGTVSGWLTSPTALAPPARVDTIRALVSDWGSHQTVTRHDRFGQMRELVDNNWVDTTTIYRTGLLPDSIRSPLGTVDRFGYDLFGNERKLIWSKPANADTTFLGYDNFGRVSMVSGPSQATQVLFRSGNAGKVDSVVVAQYRTKFDYNANGRVTKVTDPKQHVTETFYDANFGNATKILYPGARFDSVKFDRYGRDSVVVGSGSARHFLLYDGINRITRDSMSVDSSATTYGYNKEYLVRVVDAKGQVFKREVNEMGWTRKVYDPADTTRYVRHEYTVEGLPALFVNARGQWLEMTYWGDYRHRMTGQVSDSSFNVAGYAYGYRKDVPGQPNKRTGTFVAGSNRQATDSIWMDLRGRVDSVITRIAANASAGWNSSIGQRRFVRRYTWNENDQPQSIAVEARQAGTGALIRSFTPRSFNWNSSTGALDGATIGSASLSFVRNAEGLDSVWTYSAGWPRNFNYTQRHEVWASTYANSGVDAAFGRAYAYADTITGRVAQMSWVDGSDKVLRDFRYDAHGRLGRISQGTTATSQCSPPSSFDSDLDGWFCTPQTSFTPSRVLGFEYDRASNLRKQVDSVASVVDTAVNAVGNRMTSWGGRTYTYDLEGNIASRTDSSGTVNFVYGGDGLLRKVIAGSDTTCYEYNAFGQLAFRGRECGRNTQPGSTQRRVDRIFIWDGDHIIAETDSTGTKRFAEYGYLPGIDRPFALVTDSVPGTGSITRFYHQDELGNVIGLTRGNTVEQRIEYEPWGEVSSITGTVADTSRLRWKGLFWEGGNTRLYYVRNRWYDPGARRFTSQDPTGLAGGLNQYAFGHNDPVNYADPYGLEDTMVCSMQTDISVDLDTGRWSASNGCKSAGGRIGGWSMWGASAATMLPGISSFGVKPGQSGGGGAQTGDTREGVKAANACQAAANAAMVAGVNDLVALVGLSDMQVGYQAAKKALGRTGITLARRAELATELKPVRNVLRGLGLTAAPITANVVLGENPWVDAVPFINFANKFMDEVKACYSPE